MPPRPPPPDRPHVLGVLGGIASGKSEVARLLAGPEGWVIDADELVRELYAEPAFRRRVAERFGPAVLDSRGEIDRAALGAVVFADPAQRKVLESWIHPRVRERIVARLAEARAAGVHRVVLDVPLLLENQAEHQLAGMCRTLVFVDAPVEAREARAVRRRGWPSGEVARREAAQMPLDEKRRRAQHVIQNDGDLARLAAAVGELSRRLETPGAAE